MQHPWFPVLLALLALAPACSVSPDRAPAADSRAASMNLRTSDGVCDSSRHETSSIDGVYTFDYHCAMAWLGAAGCDFTLDPDGDGRPLHSSILEDLYNDASTCRSGMACSGCTDADSLSTITTCEDLAATSNFTQGAWSDLQVACPVTVESEPATCTMEGVAFSTAEYACAQQLFSTMTCESCASLFDSRICEDAINDPSLCQVGGTCTGCTDGDGRANGADCDEIAAYSYFGASAAASLRAWVLANPCTPACTPACNGRSCGDDGCGGTCGLCASQQICDTNGACVADATSVEGVFFSATELACAERYFETMDCTTCATVLDSRVCEDAINDPSACQVGGTCTGCTDGDSRGDGVDAAEIAAYSYFGATAASALLAFVQADTSCGEPELVVDGIPMTATQATAVLAVANGASQTQLDDDAQLDARAAANIVSARPLADIEALAAVSYVGGTAMAALLVYSETWVPSEGGESVCALVVSAASSQTATDFSRLLSIATTTDRSYAEVIALQASGCTGWQTDAVATEAMTIALWDAAFGWAWGEVPSSYLDIGAPTAGGASFTRLVDRSSAAITERTADGLWNPATNAEGAALLARLAELVAALEGPAAANPTDWVEIRIYVDMSECSEEAVGLIQLSTGAILLIHENAHC